MLKMEIDLMLHCGIYRQSFDWADTKQLAESKIAL